MTVLRRSLRAFGHFWWDFLIGDSPEFVLATGVIIALAFLLDEGRLVATIVLPLVAAAFLLASTYRGRKRATRSGGSGRSSGVAGLTADCLRGLISPGHHPDSTSSDPVDLVPTPQLDRQFTF